jgi:hypothetical protein
MPETDNPLIALAESLREIRDTVAAIAQKLTPILQDFALLGDATRRLDQAGWLPHYTTPFKLVLQVDRASLDARMSEYYDTNWKQVRDAILARAQGYEVDTEAMATFREALTVHGHGLYRSCCRVLFPEVERVSRIEVHGGREKDRITSQKELIALVDRLPAGVVLTDPWALELYRKLSNHLYQKVTEENRTQFESIPNRHAAVHGRIVYSSLKNSMNTIIMVDYIFAVISATKAYGRSTGQL